MKRHIKKKACRAAHIALAAGLVLMTPLETAAGSWHTGVTGWTYEKDDGSYMSSGWLKDGGRWYHFDANGLMETGWILDGGTWYFLNPASNTSDTEGAMLTGWQWVDGKCYYLEPSGTDGHPEGSLYTGCVTPDGYSVNADGAWTDSLGNAVYEEGRGISTAKAYASVSSGGTYHSSGGGGFSGGSSGSSGSSKSAASPEPESTESSTAPEGTAGEKQEEDNAETPEEESGSGDTGESSDGSRHETEDDVTDTGTGELPGYDVTWHVHFVDAESHGIVLAEEETGTAANGTSVSLSYMTRIIDSDGQIWTALKEPYSVTVYGPGEKHIYVEYVRDGELPEEEDPYEDLRERLSGWEETAKEADSVITGEETGHMDGSSVICDTDSACALRLRTAADRITDTAAYSIYVIGRNCVPNGITLKEYYGENIVYSNSVADRFEIDGDTYTVALFTVRRIFTEENCLHDWETVTEKAATCLEKGTDRMECSLCGRKVKVMSAPLGHEDEDLDSVCDRCGKRTYAQQAGDRINTVLTIGGTDYEDEYILVDEDWQGGMLYIASEGLPASALGGYGTEGYEKSGVFSFFADEFANCFSIHGDPLMVISGDGTGAYAAMLSEEEAEAIAGTAGGTIVTRTLSGGSLVTVNEDGTEGLADPSDPELVIRPAILLSIPDEGTSHAENWDEGDFVSRDINGRTVIFRCVDENYSDKLENNLKSALFLSETLIPSTTDSDYVWEDTGDGHYGYVWHPGPVAVFGSSNDYKYSDIRAWLDEVTVYDAADIQIGVPNAYTGSTEEGKYGEFNENELKTHEIGYQKMNARLFILSVEEALKYRDYLWKFECSDTDNPEDVTETGAHAYWLRSPAGTSYDYAETGQVYVVDLDSGSIHPAAVAPSASGDEAADTMTNIGVRPAFTMPQSRN